MAQARQQQPKQHNYLDWLLYVRGKKLATPVAGVDEVGRGCLAGPVYAGAVIFRSDLHLEHIKDSKKLSEIQREKIAPLICEAHDVGIGFATVEEIDQYNILQASFIAMKRALNQLRRKTGLSLGHVLVDGHMRIPGLRTPQTPVIGGDASELVIGAASIVAKVTRDRVMKEMSLIYPHYGFHNHKGYASVEHRRAIEKHGPCILHRRFFRGVKEWHSCDFPRVEDGAEL